jgi:lipoprotein-anchoring transpeptidase ErfK/SrfK
MVCRRPASFTIVLSMFASMTVACRQPRTLSGGVEPPSPSSAGPVLADAGLAPSAGAVSDAGSYDGPWIGAIVMQAPIWSEMETPNDRRGEHDSKSVRLGYLRYGERAPVIPEVHKKSNCAEGWYELVSGGFICGKLATMDLDHPKFKLAKAPNLDGSLPYLYGVNLWNGTPLYRSVPSREQRKKFEPWLFKPKKPKMVDEDRTYAPASLATSIADSGVSDPGALEDADTPWWDKEIPDGGPPQITLEDLQESGGPIARRMVKGFYLSLDREIDVGGTQWWKTIAGLSAPADRILVSKPVTEFHGVWLGKDAATFATKNVASRRIDKLPVGFVLNYFAKRWMLDEARKHASVAPGALDRFDAIGLTGDKARANGYEFWETDEGWWLRAIDATKTEPGPAPDKLGEGEKWIDVNLKRQTLVAFEGATPVFVTVVSSGRNEHETPPGSFRIREKHISATMDGDSDTATDGPYSIEDVPYIEYFNAGYALHGAFWHGAFGSVKSHGCVNLAPWDAKAVFGWTDPPLPEGWHAVFANKDTPGTRVVVHEKGPGTCEGPKAEPPQCPDH